MVTGLLFVPDTLDGLGSQLWLWYAEGHGVTLTRGHTDFRWITLLPRVRYGRWVANRS